MPETKPPKTPIDRNSPTTFKSCNLLELSQTITLEKSWLCARIRIYAALSPFLLGKSRACGGLSHPTGKRWTEPLALVVRSSSRAWSRPSHSQCWFGANKVDRDYEKGTGRELIVAMTVDIEWDSSARRSVNKVSDCADQRYEGKSSCCGRGRRRRSMDWNAGAEQILRLLGLLTILLPGTAKLCLYHLVECQFN